MVAFVCNGVLIAGVYALIVRRPYAVYHPLLLLGLIGSFVFIYVRGESPEGHPFKPSREPRRADGHGTNDVVVLDVRQSARVSA